MRHCLYSTVQYVNGEWKTYKTIHTVDMAYILNVKIMVKTNHKTNQLVAWSTVLSWSVVSPVQHYLSILAHGNSPNSIFKILVYTVKWFINSIAAGVRQPFLHIFDLPLTSLVRFRYAMHQNDGYNVSLRFFFDPRPRDHNCVLIGLKNNNNNSIKVANPRLYYLNYQHFTV